MLFRGPAFVLMLCICFPASVLVSGCDNSTTFPPEPTAQASSGHTAVQPQTVIGYKPPVIPAKVTYNFTTGEVWVSLDGEVQTPIGTFSLSNTLSLQNQPSVSESDADTTHGIRTRCLLVEFGSVGKKYPLTVGARYQILLPDDENGRGYITIAGDDSDIVVRIPNPSSETLASLRAQNAALRAQLSPTTSPTHSADYKRHSIPVLRTTGFWHRASPKRYAYRSHYRRLPSWPRYSDQSASDGQDSQSYDTTYTTTSDYDTKSETTDDSSSGECGCSATDSP